MARVLIGMVGRARAGKDSFAARLIERHGFVGYAFADNLRKAMLALDPIVDVEGATGYDYGYGGESPIYLSSVIKGWGWEGAKERLPEVRRLLQALGTDAIRALDPDFWVRPVMREIRSIGARPVVITDVRFPNEAAAVEQAGGKLVRVIRPDQEGADMHVSETALDDWGTDYDVVNDSTVEHLHTQADWVSGLVKWRSKMTPGDGGDDC